MAQPRPPARASGHPEAGELREQGRRLLVHLSDALDWADLEMLVIGWAWGQQARLQTDKGRLAHALARRLGALFGMPWPEDR